jgi:hypothetical protein
MIGFGEIVIVTGVFALAGTYLWIVRSFINSGERETAPTQSASKKEDLKSVHALPAVSTR